MVDGSSVAHSGVRSAAASGYFDVEGFSMEIRGYHCIDKDCPKRWRWQPGVFSHQASFWDTYKGIDERCKTCLYNAYHGCPHPLPLRGESSKDYFARIGVETSK